MNKMRNKLVITITLIVAISVLTLGIFFTNLLEEIYIDAITNRLEKEASLIKMLIPPDLEITNNESLNRIVQNIGEELSTRITLIDIQGKVLADSEYYQSLMENHADRPEVKDAFLGEKGKEIRYSHTLGINMLYLAVPIEKNMEVIGAVRVALPLQEIKASLQAFWYSLMLGLIIIFFITFLFSYRIANKITKPLEHMTSIAMKITNKDYSERFQMKRNDEIGLLGKAINLMAESLEEQMTTIQENEKKLTSVLDNMSSGIILVDKNGIILLANPALEYLIGDISELIVGKHHQDIGQKTMVSELIDRSLQSGESFHKEIGIYEPTKRYINSNIIPIIDDNGAIIGVLAMLHDITQIKLLENMRTEFVASVSHELRTPITAIKGFAETLLDGAITEEETRNSFYTIIYQESERLHRLINDLLDLSKIELNKDVLKYTVADVKGLIETTIETMLPQADKRKVILEKDLTPIIAKVDEDRLKQVVINLVTNAIAYTPEKGRISVRLTTYKKNQFKLEVEDTGIGIPEKSLPRIFERFYRVDKARARESGGTGLGLAIVKHIVESHRGKIQVKSKVNQGTTFTIILPIEQVGK